MRYGLVTAALGSVLASAALADSAPDVPKTTPIVVIDPNDPARQAACADAADARARRDCISREANQAGWEMSFYEGLAPPDPELGTPTDKAVRQLQKLVDLCQLGPAYYMRHTDGMASLHLGNPDLTPKQLECIVLNKGSNGALRKKAQ